MKASAAAGRWKRWLRRAAVAALALSALALLIYLCRAPILGWVGAQLIREDAVSTADVIVVLSGGVPDRELEAVDLFREGYAPRILLPHDPERAGIQLLRQRGMVVERSIDLRVRILSSLGVPASAITILPPEIESTDEEAKAVIAWAREHKVQSLIVVTSRFHTGRTRLTYAHFAPPGLRIMVRAARADTFTPANWWRSRTNLRNGLFEWQKQVLYRLRY